MTTFGVYLPCGDELHRLYTSKRWDTRRYSFTVDGNHPDTVHIAAAFGDPHVPSCLRTAQAVPEILDRLMPSTEALNSPRLMRCFVTACHWHIELGLAPGRECWDVAVANYQNTAVEFHDANNMWSLELLPEPWAARADRTEDWAAMNPGMPEPWMDWWAQTGRTPLTAARLQRVLSTRWVHHLESEVPGRFREAWRSAHLLIPADTVS